jgi:hypothetical protein
LAGKTGGLHAESAFLTHEGGRLVLERKLSKGPGAKDPAGDTPSDEPIAAEKARYQQIHIAAGARPRNPIAPTGQADPGNESLERKVPLPKYAIGSVTPYDTSGAPRKAEPAGRARTATSTTLTFFMPCKFAPTTRIQTEAFGGLQPYALRFAPTHVSILGRPLP